MALPCLLKTFAAVALTAGATYAATSATAAAPPPAVTCTASAKACQYVADLADANLPVPSNAVNAAGIICINLRSGVTPEAQARSFQLAHSTTFSLGQAEQYIEITQKDMC